MASLEVHLVSTGISWPALDQVRARRFFYGVTLGHAEIPERFVYARGPRTPPVVLIADEVIHFLEAAPTEDADGLGQATLGPSRFGDVGLKVGDTDSESGVIRIEHGKGNPP
ncbi:hypothetical protein [Mesorhizobium muleiense]|uniref:hypothetical protein n=1 Tax=Mesorhizobium muleiense TaxID=1004279 RepID=UPI001F166110|nr:hypothetical protein [Mesorhizobium muleiense]MCF6109003.1 hypothetical protein [Mesorhizobium muleiense]